MEATTGEHPPALWLLLAVVATPVVAGGSLFLLLESGPIHRLGLFLIGGGVLVGGVLLLWRVG